jgi:hypothetical protein
MDNAELEQCANRVIAMEFIVRALLAKSAVKRADVQALLNPHRWRASPGQQEFVENCIADFFIPLAPDERPQ